MQPDPARSAEGGPAAAAERFTQYAGLETLTIRPDSTFQMIGERTNVTGSARFKRLVKSGDFAQAADVALEQVRGGANILDVNMDEAMLDADAAMTRFLNLIATEPEIARLPVMIDSSRWSVIEAGLQCIQGKAIVNSISLKEGEEEFLRKAEQDRLKLQKKIAWCLSVRRCPASTCRGSSRCAQCRTPGTSAWWLTVIWQTVLPACTRTGHADGAAGQACCGGWRRLHRPGDGGEPDPPRA